MKKCKCKSVHVRAYHKDTKHGRVQVKAYSRRKARK